jgi:hypothetical protein
MHHRTWANANYPVLLTQQDATDQADATITLHISLLSKDRNELAACICII